MRINKFVAQATGLSRRSTDKAILEGRVTVNDMPASLGLQVSETDTVAFDTHVINLPKQNRLVIMNKPVGYVCSRRGQGSPSIYDLLPRELIHLKSIGRLDKDSSGIIVFTDDGELANKLSHPSYEKIKVYEVRLDHPLSAPDKRKIESGEIILDDKPSKMIIKSKDASNKLLEVSLKEGRNKQIRRTFAALEYSVVELKRLQFGPYKLDQLGDQTYLELDI